MEATLNDARDLPKGKPGVSPQLRLPGEEDGPTETLRVPTVEARDRLSTRPNGGSSRGVLMSTVGIVFLIGAVGYMGYAQRAQLERSPAVHLVVKPVDTSIWHKLVMTAANRAPAMRHAQPKILAPLAGDATVHHPDTEKASKPQASPVPPIVSKLAALAPNSEQAQLQQFDALQTSPGGNAPSSSPVAPAKPSPAPITATAPSTPLEQKASLSTQPFVPPSPKVAMANPVAPSASMPNPVASVQHAPAVVQSPISQAVALTAAPMTDQQQLDVLHLLTELGVLVRDQRSELAALRDQVSGLSSKMNTQLTDFDRRLSIAEAKGAIDAAMGAADATEAATISQAAEAGRPVKIARQVPRPSSAPAPAPIIRSVSDYDIQAASPGLAMLTTTDDGGSSIQVGVGDMVPGIGRVTSIYQSGTTWVVKTDHGMIQ